MGVNFYDYDGIQPKLSPPKHFSRQCTWTKYTHYIDFNGLSSRSEPKTSMVLPGEHSRQKNEDVNCR